MADGGLGLTPEELAAYNKQQTENNSLPLQPTKQVDPQTRGWVTTNSSAGGGEVKNRSGRVLTPQERAALEARLRGNTPDSQAASVFAPGGSGYVPPKPPPPPPPGVLDEMRSARNRLLGMQFRPTDTSKMDKMYGDTMSTFDRQVAEARARAAADPARQNMLLLAQGQGPAADAARAQLREGIDASNAQAMSMAASARGGAGARALGARAAMQQAALNNQTGANQAAGLRAQMSMQGIQGLAGLRRDDMAMDQGFTTARGEMGRGMGDTYGRIGMADSANKAQFDLGKYGTALGSMNDSGQLILGQGRNDISNRELDIKEATAGNDVADRAAGKTAGQVSETVNTGRQVLGKYAPTYNYATGQWEYPK